VGHISILGSGVALDGCSCQTISETLATDACETVRHIPEKRVGGTGADERDRRKHRSTVACHTVIQMTSLSITGLPLQPNPIDRSFEV